MARTKKSEEGAEAPVEIVLTDPDPKRRFKEVLAKLSEKISDDQIKTREEGGATLSYIEWHTACDVLDKVAGDWENDIKEVKVVDNKLFITGSITIDGRTRTNVGWEFLTRTDRNGEVKEIAFGDVFTNAFSMYLKRAAAIFGVARHLYKKDGPEVQSTSERPANRSAAPANATPAKAVARTDGKIEALLLGEKTKEKKAGGEYTAFFVEAKGREHPVFFNRDFDFGDLMTLVKAPANVKFPFKCLVTLKKEGKFENISGFYPFDGPATTTAPSDTAPSSVTPEDDIPF